jgi:hypothetical protein
LTRRLLHPVAALADQAGRIVASGGEALPPAAATAPSGVREFDMMHSALAASQAALRDRAESARGAAAAHAESEQRFRTFFETAPFGVA